jgi:hypothetical protein
MGRRSNFERLPRDFYPTPIEAVRPLVPFLLHEDDYVEPCAGDGALVNALRQLAPWMECLDAFDIEPMADGIAQRDALSSRYDNALTITNPPWDRKILHPLIERLTENGGRAWLLFDAEWVHTRQSAPYIPRLRKIVSVGRVKWIPDSKMTGKDSCAWHYFTQPSEETTQFYGRT